MATRHNGPKYRIDAYGIVSEGTLRDQDLLEAFSDKLEELSKSREHKALIKEARAMLDGTSMDHGDADEMTELVIALSDALDSLAPPYFRFGSHEGDGACFGFFFNEDSFEEARRDHFIEDIEDEDLPRGYTGEACYVSDHGNVSLYAVSRGRKRLLWSIV